ncbi:MAG: RDD family protein, partial [Oleispira sp.]
MPDLNLPSAPLWRRLMAMVYDLFNILGISFLLGVILLFSSAQLFNDGEPLGALPFSVAASYFFIIIFFFYSTFWR